MYTADFTMLLPQLRAAASYMLAMVPAVHGMQQDARVVRFEQRCCSGKGLGSLPIKERKPSRKAV
jgi:hypothetical protein